MSDIICGLASIAGVDVDWCKSVVQGKKIDTPVGAACSRKDPKEQIEELAAEGDLSKLREDALRGKHNDKLLAIVALGRYAIENREELQKVKRILLEVMAGEPLTSDYRIAVMAALMEAETGMRATQKGFKIPTQKEALQRYFEIYFDVLLNDENERAQQNARIVLKQSIGDRPLFLVFGTILLNRFEKASSEEEKEQIKKDVLKALNSKDIDLQMGAYFALMTLVLDPGMYSEEELDEVVSSLISALEVESLKEGAKMALRKFAESKDFPLKQKERIMKVLGEDASQGQIKKGGR